MPTLDWRRPRTNTPALAGIIGPIWFTTLVILQGFILPDYSHVRLPISALAAWPAGWIQNVNFFVFGALTTAFAIGVDRVVRKTPYGSLGTALLMIGGIGIVLAGAFPWRMIDGVPSATAPHIVAGLLSFVATALGLIVFSVRMRADPRWRDLATYTMVTGIVVLLLFVSIGLFAVADDAPLHPYAGLMQRIVCAAWFTCTVVLALRLRRQT
jgi:hypothetical membrane protein